jgi:predicted ATPase
MIAKWKLANFKSIREETELSMGPLTIFAGPNSSGKSTFIQSILLVSQTLTSNVRSRSVILNGYLGLGLEFPRYHGHFFTTLR